VARIAQCRLCSDPCDVLAIAAVGTVGTVVWTCPMRLGSERTDRAISLVLIRAALTEDLCIVIRESDVEGWTG
jgi:hypothetical protein